MTAPRRSVKKFELRLMLSGIMLHHFNSASTRLTVVVPDARAKDGKPPTNHGDGTPGEPHVGYVRFSLANYAHDEVSARFPSGFQDNPDFEVVHRFDGEQLSFEPLGDEALITGAKDLEVPDRKDVAPVMEPMAGLFTTPPVPSVLMRLELSGGKVEVSATDPVQWRFDGNLREDGRPHTGSFGGEVVWRRMIEGDGLTMKLERFSDGRVVQIPLQPSTDPGDSPAITLKVANLCSVNPAEWPELMPRVAVGPDVDFKFIYRLMQLRGGLAGGMFNASVMPIPFPVFTNTTNEGRVYNCLPMKVFA